MTEIELAEGESFIELVYAGRRLNTRDDVRYAWSAVDSEADRWYKKQLVSGAGIGSVFRFVVSENSVYTAGPKGPQFIRRLEGDHPIWFAADREAEAGQLQAAARRRAKQVDPIAQFKRDLAKVAYQMTKPQRRALMMELMDAVGL